MKRFRRVKLIASLVAVGAAVAVVATVLLSTVWADTDLVRDINPGSGGSFPNFLTDAGGTLFFSAFHPTSGGELWKSDGTEAGTVLVKDINPSGTSSPLNLTPNPPKDTDGRREGSGRGWVRELQGRWPGVLG